MNSTIIVELDDLITQVFAIPPQLLNDDENRKISDICRNMLEASLTLKEILENHKNVG